MGLADIHRASGPIIGHMALATADVRNIPTMTHAELAQALGLSKSEAKSLTCNQMAARLRKARSMAGLSSPELHPPAKNNLGTSADRASGGPAANGLSEAVDRRLVALGHRVPASDQSSGPDSRPGDHVARGVVAARPAARNSLEAAVDRLVASNYRPPVAGTAGQDARLGAYDQSRERSSLGEAVDRLVAARCA